MQWKKIKWMLGNTFNGLTKDEYYYLKGQNMLNISPILE